MGIMKQLAEDICDACYPCGFQFLQRRKRMMQALQLGHGDRLETVSIANVRGRFEDEGVWPELTPVDLLVLRSEVA